jgi:hypothetical protein
VKQKTIYFRIKLLIVKEIRSYFEFVKKITRLLHLVIKCYSTLDIASDSGLLSILKNDNGAGLSTRRGFLSVPVVMETINLPYLSFCDSGKQAFPFHENVLIHIKETYCNIVLRKIQNIFKCIIVF